MSITSTKTASQKYRITTCGKPPPPPPPPAPATHKKHWQVTVCHNPTCDHNCIDGMKYHNYTAISDTCYDTSQSYSIDIICSGDYYKARTFYTRDCNGRPSSSGNWMKSDLCTYMGSGRYTKFTCDAPPSPPTPTCDWSYMLCDDPMCAKNCVDALDSHNLTAGDVCVTHNHTTYYNGRPISRSGRLL